MVRRHALAGEFAAQGVQPRVDRPFQRAQPRFQRRAVGRVRIAQAAVQRVADGAARARQGAGGGIEGRLFQMQRHLPQAALHRVQRFLPRRLQQSLRVQPQLQPGAVGVPEGLGLREQPDDRVGRHRPALGRQAEHLADRHQRARQRVAEARRRQQEGCRGAAPGLAGAVAPLQPRDHRQAGPGAGGEIDDVGPALRNAAARRAGRCGRGLRRPGRQRDAQRHRLRVQPAAQPQPGLQRHHAVIVAAAPGQARLQRIGRQRSGRRRPGHIGRLVRQHGERPGAEWPPAPSDREPPAGGERRLGAEPVGPERADRDRLPVEPQRRAPRSAVQADREARTGWDRGRRRAGAQIDRGKPGVGRRGDPGEQPRRRRRGGPAGPQRLGEPPRRAIPGDHHGRHQRHRQAAAQALQVAPCQPRMRPADPQPTDRRRRARPVRLPQGQRRRVGMRRAVGQCRQRSVRQAGGMFQLSVRRRRIGPGDPAQPAQSEAEDHDRGHDRQRRRGRRRQRRLQPEQGGDKERPGHTDGRPQRRPEALHQQHAAREPAPCGQPWGRREIPRPRRGRRRGPGGHPGQSGRISSRHRLASSGRGRITAQRPASTSTSAAGGRAL